MKDNDDQVEEVQAAYGSWAVPNDAELAQRVEDGLPVVDLVGFGRNAGFSGEELANLVHIPARTYARRVAAQSRLSVPEGERAVRIMRLYDRARRVFGSHANTGQWLHAPLPALAGRTPLDFARTEPGAREVENLLGRIEHGVFA